MDRERALWGRARIPSRDMRSSPGRARPRKCVHARRKSDANQTQITSKLHAINTQTRALVIDKYSTLLVDDISFYIVVSVHFTTTSRIRLQLPSRPHTLYAYYSQIITTLLSIYNTFCHIVVALQLSHSRHLELSFQIIQENFCAKYKVQQLLVL